jgi:PhnB protein
MAVRPIPEGYHSLTPYLCIKGAAKLIDFLKQAFGAKELHRSTRPDGSVWHAELNIGDSRLMMAEASEQWPPMPCALYLYVEDVDATYRKAIAAGATSAGEPVDQFYGDRSGGVKDPAGNTWWIGTHVEDVAPEEMARRQQAFAQKQATA